MPRYPHSHIRYRPPSFDYELTSALRLMLWPKDWEWTLDFPEIWVLLTNLLHYKLCRIWYQVGVWLGFQFMRATPVMHHRVEFQEFHAADIGKVIDEIAYKSLILQNGPIMLVVGPDQARHLRIAEFHYLQVEHGMHYQSPLGDVYLYHDIPVVVSPYADDVVVLPDLVRSARWQAVSLRTDRRNTPEYIAQMAQERGREYLVAGMLPRWPDESSQRARRQHISFLANGMLDAPTRGNW